MEPFIYDNHHDGSPDINGQRRHLRCWLGRTNSPGRALLNPYAIVYDRAQPNTLRITVVFLRNTWLSITVVYDLFLTNCTGIVCNDVLKTNRTYPEMVHRSVNDTEKYDR